MKSSVAIGPLSAKRAVGPCLLVLLLAAVMPMPTLAGWSLGSGRRALQEPAPAPLPAEGQSIQVTTADGVPVEVSAMLATAATTTDGSSDSNDSTDSTDSTDSSGGTSYASADQTIGGPYSNTEVTDGGSIGDVDNSGSGTGVSNTGSFNAPTANNFATDDGILDDNSSNNALIQAGGNPTQNVHTGDGDTVQSGPINGAGGSSATATTDGTGDAAVGTEVMAGGDPTLSIDGQNHTVQVTDSFNSYTNNTHTTNSTTFKETHNTFNSYTTVQQQPERVVQQVVVPAPAQPQPQAAPVPGPLPGTCGFNPGLMMVCLNLPIAMPPEIQELLQELANATAAYTQQA